MTTKRKFPSVGVPIADPQGNVGREWYQLLVNEAHVGEVATAAAAGSASALPATPAGYTTDTVNGVQVLRAYWAVPP